MLRIGFVGLPSSGKTTAANYLATNLTGYRVALIPEFARDYMRAKGDRIINAQEQIGTSVIQSELEVRALMTVPQIMITDTPLFITEAYTRYYYPYADFSTNEKLSLTHKYDVIFYCKGDTWKEDGIRFQNPEALEGLEKMINKMVKKYHKKEIIILPIDKNERREYLSQWLSAQKHFYKQ